MEMPQPTYHTTDLSDSAFLVTGGAGFIGSNIVAYLLKNGAGKVRVLDNLSTGSLANIAPFMATSQIEWMEGDIRDIATCQKAMEGIDYVSHQAALGSVPRSIADPLYTHAVNIDGFVNVLHTAKAAGIKRMVYAASSSTYGDHPALPKKEEIIGNPLSPYAVTKLVNELYASAYSRVYGFHTIGMRYFNIYGPKQNPEGPYAAVIPLFIKAALNNQSPFINGDGLNSRDFTYVENAVQANIKAMLKADLSQHEVVNIAVGESISLNELWDGICSRLGIQLSAEYREARSGDVRYSLADISKARELIGYDPQFRFSEGLDHTIDWFREAYGK